VIRSHIETNVALRALTTGGTGGTFRSPGLAPTFSTIDREYWKTALGEAGRQLEAATKRSAVNAAANKVMRAKQELKWLEQAPAVRPPRRRSPRHDLIGLVDLEAREFQVLDDPFGERLARVVGDVLLEEAAQKVAAAGDGEADREHELCAEGAAIHRS
jgi:hypothetical protein